MRKYPNASNLFRLATVLGMCFLFALSLSVTVDAYARAYDAAVYRQEEARRFLATQNCDPLSVPPDNEHARDLEAARMTGCTRSRKAQGAFVCIEATRQALWAFISCYNACATVSTEGDSLYLFGVIGEGWDYLLSMLASIRCYALYIAAVWVWWQIGVHVEQPVNRRTIKYNTIKR